MGPKKKKGNPVIDGVDTSSMSREQLEKFAHNLRNEMEREREERNFFQLERDKLRTFWEITRQRLEDAQIQIRAKDREIEVTQETSELDIKHTIQQMKHLQYENQTRIGELRAEAMTQLKLAQEDHGLQELELLNDKRELKRIIREKEEMTELQIQQLKMKNSELLSQEYARFKQEADEMNKLHEEKLQEYIVESGIKHRMEMNEVEERKTFQISKLIEAHEKAFSKMKLYYNEITESNLSLIDSLKEQMETLRYQSEQNERKANELTTENRKLSETLKSAQNELIQLRQKLENLNKDRASLNRTKSRYTATSKKLNDIQFETDVLTLRCEKLVEERDKLKENFEAAILELHQKTNLKNVLLERKLVMLGNEAEKREAILSELLNASGVDQHTLNAQIEKLLQSKNDKIQDLHYELAKITKSHDDLLATFEAKMREFGIPKEELGFQPLRSTAILKYGYGPAGLVADQK